MRLLCLMGWLALASGCSSFGVRCDSRLRPINLREPQMGQSRAPDRAVAPAVPSSMSSQSVRP
jgi:hypothetical protein